MQISRFEKNLDAIKNYFKRAQKSIFNFADINKILEDKKLEWTLPKTLTTNKFLKLLLEQTLFRYRCFQYVFYLRYSFCINYFTAEVIGFPCVSQIKLQIPRLGKYKRK